MSSIKKNYIYNTIYQILVLIIPVITTPYITRVLKADGLGTYSYYYSIVNYFVLFVMLGLNTYGNRSIASIKDNKELLFKTFKEIYLFQLTTGIIVLILYYLCWYIYFDKNKYSLIMGIFILASIFDINWFFAGLEKFKVIVMRNFIIKFLSTVLIFVIVKEKEDLLKYCIILSLATLFSNLSFWVYNIKIIICTKIEIKQIFRHLKPNLYLFMTVLAVSFFKIMDKIMLGLMSSKTEVGYFEAAEKIISLPIILIISLGTVMLPRITSMMANNDTRNMESYLNNSMKLAFFLSTSIGFGIMGISKEFVPLFYGEDYRKCIYLFLILLPSCIFLAVANVVRTQYIIPKQLDEIYVKSAFLGAGINLILNIFLISKYGSIGSAIATLFAEIGVCVYQLGRVRKEIKIIPNLKEGIIFISSGIIMFIIIYNIRFDMKLINLLIVKIILGMSMYALLLLIQILLKKMIKEKV